MKLHKAQLSAILPKSLQRVIYPKISLLPGLSQINTIASFIKFKISDFQTRFHNEYWLLTAPGKSRRQRADFLCIGRRLTHYPVE